jgi:hypothetical protein
LHALPDELLAWLETWLSKGNFRAAVVRLNPELSVVEVSSAGAFQAEIAERGLPFRVCLARAPFDLAAASLYEFMTKNTSECIVDIGAMTHEGLKESSITISSDAEKWRFWSSAVRDVKSNTKAGLWAVSPVTGARELSKNNRYTAAAAKLVGSGRKLLPLAGWNFFEIGDGAEKT